MGVGLAGSPTAAATGVPGAFGAAADAEKASAKRTVAMMSKVNNPIFLKRLLQVRFPDQTRPLNFGCPVKYCYSFQGPEYATQKLGIYH